VTRFLILLLLATFCLVNHAVLAKPTGSEWVLKQNSLDLGPLNVFVAGDAVKIECTRQGYCVLAKAPDWQVYYFRPIEKTFWVSSLESFNGLMMVNPFCVSKYSKGSANKVGVIKYAGLPCVQLRPANKKMWIEFASDEISTNPKVCEFINRYYYLPDTGRVPLYRKIEAPDNKRKLNNQWLTGDMSADLRNQPRVVLTTVDAKKVDYRSADFDIPQNFKRVHNVNDISLSTNSKQQINEMVDSLGFTNDFAAAPGEKPKH
jgi:hypothetical protein